MINYKRLKEIREDNDISQENISKILNVPRATYSMWELGVSIIPLRKLCKFADYFDCSIDYALGLTKNKNNKNLIKGFELKNLAGNLKYYRKKNNLTQENVADILGVFQSCIMKYETMRTTIPVDKLYKLSKEYKVSLNELCGKTKK